MDRARTQVAPRRAVFTFAHQDDEYGVFHVIEELVRSGGKAVCLYLTNGAFAGQPMARRNAESLRALRALGVDAADVHFLGGEHAIPDGELHLHLDTAYRSVLAVVQRYERVDDLFVLAWEGGHQDHDAAHLVGMALAVQLGLLDRTRQFPLYNGSGLPWILFRVLAPLPENGPVIASRIPWRMRLSYALGCVSYPSQLKTWIGLFPFMFLDLVFAGVQRLQPVSIERLALRPHAGRLLYERRGALSWDRFREVTRAFVARHVTNSHGDRTARATRGRPSR